MGTWYNEIGHVLAGQMTGKDFEIINHTADVGIIAYGSDIRQLFSNAALALFSLITDTESIVEKIQKDVQVISKDSNSLLVDWLNELIYLFDTQRVLFSRFDIKKLSNNQLITTCWGESFDPLKHKIRIEVKAATYHMLKINKDDGKYNVQVIFDV